MNQNKKIVELNLELDKNLEIVKQINNKQTENLENISDNITGGNSYIRFDFNPISYSQKNLILEISCSGIGQHFMYNNYIRILDLTKFRKDLRVDKNGYLLSNTSESVVYDNTIELIRPKILIYFSKYVINDFEFQRTFNINTYSKNGRTFQKTILRYKNNNFLKAEFIFSFTNEEETEKVLLSKYIQEDFLNPNETEKELEKMEK